MANKTLFRSTHGAMPAPTDTVNEAGGTAYSFTAEHALAQYAVTGCLNSTYYADADTQLDKVQELCGQVETDFIAKTALYCRTQGYMKDMPALLCAVLATRGPVMLERVFGRVIDNGKMLRNFVQIIRSGAVGRKSFGTRIKWLIQNWLNAKSADALFAASVGNDPSLADVIRMVHPKPDSVGRRALYGYLLDREHSPDELPDKVRDYEAFKRGELEGVPDVPFQKLTGLDLTTDQWAAIARNAPWQMCRMNLNAFARHGVFDVRGMAQTIAEKIRDAEAVRKSRVFPYQLLMAYHAASADVPHVVREALQDAMEVATENVPAIDGKVYVFPDVSGSMGSPVTGYRKGATTSVRCVDVAALVAACVLRNNADATVIPFDTEAHANLRLNPRDTVMTNAKKLASRWGGGTNCSAPLAYLNSQQATGDLAIYVSDNESWFDSQRAWRGTQTSEEWATFKRRNPHARLVCIDIQPYAHAQVEDRDDTLNVGGFSDNVFSLIATFVAGGSSGEHWVNVINSMEL